MAYDPTVPNEANVVRGAGNDLQQMQENFSLLSGAAVKGISGLIGVDANTPVSGEALRFNGSNWVPSGAADDLDSLTDVTITAPASGEVVAFDGSGWINSGLVIAQALDDLTDVNAPGPISGEALVFDGADWVASGLISPSPRAVLGLSGTSTYTVTGVSFDERVPLSSVLTSGAPYQFDTTSGEIRVVDPNVTSVNILAQVGWVGPLEAAAMYVTKIFKNGSGLDQDSVYKVAAESTMRGTVSGGHWTNQASALNVPCASGDEFTLVVHTDDAAGTRVVSGQKTYLLVEDARKGGGSGGNFSDPADVWLPHIPPRPGNAHIMNDEFNPDDGDGAGPGGLDSRWQEWDTAGLGVPTLLSGANMLNMVYTQGSFWSGVVQTISGLGATPSGENWEVYARMHVNIERSNASSDMSYGMALFENAVAAPTTSNFAAVLARLTTSGLLTNFEVGEFNDRSDIPPATSGSVIHSVSGLLPGIWFRVRHQGGTNRFDGDVSTDGITWRQIGTRTLAWAPVEIGLIGIDVLEGGAGTRVRASLFRVVSGLSNRHDMIPAGKVRMERTGDNTTDSF